MLSSTMSCQRFDVRRMAGGVARASSGFACVQDLMDLISAASNRSEGMA